MPTYLFSSIIFFLRRIASPAIEKPIAVSNPANDADSPVLGIMPIRFLGCGLSSGVGGLGSGSGVGVGGFGVGSGFGAGGFGFGLDQV